MPPPDEVEGEPVDPRHAARLSSFLKWMVVAILSFIPVDVLAYYVYRDVRSILIAGAVLLMAAGFAWARRQLGKGRMQTAVAVTATSFLLPVLVLVIIRPHLYPVIAVGPVLGLAVALPIARGGTIRALVAAAFLSCVTIIGIGLYLQPELFATGESTFRTITMASAHAVVLGMVLMLLYFFGGSLATALREARRSEVALRSSNEQLVALDRLKTQFVNNAAHELNTPLTPIRLQVHLLRDRMAKEADAQVKRSVEIVHRNVERMMTLVRDILDASRIQGDRMMLQRQPSDLREALREAYESFRDPARASGVELELKVSTALPLEFDVRRITQVLFNLIGNAIKFTPAGGRITLEGWRDDEAVHVRVADTGMGIRAEDLDRLFQPFSQVGPEQDRRPGGTGLGLYIARGIVEEHGGRIWAESDGLNRGTRFNIQLPLGARQPPAAVPAPAPIPKRRPAPSVDAMGQRLRELI